MIYVIVVIVELFHTRILTTVVYWAAAVVAFGHHGRSPESFCSIRPRFRQWSSELRMEGGGEIPADEIPLARGRGRGRGRPRVRVVDDTFVEQAADQLEQLRMDELVARFHSMHPPRFSGSEGAEKAELWISEIEELFDLIEYPLECRLRLAVHQLKDRAKMWWSTTLMTLDAQRIVPSWDIFKLKFKESYCPPSFYSSKASEFHNLKQGDMSIAEYADSFYAMLRYAPHVAASQVAVVESFIEGLNDHLHPFVSTGKPLNYLEAMEIAKRA
ncbi:uncharacterized protein [Primulina huaijiensis]|uniref:uncharacterized protein isoform X2 n=1 Tax=Primulina huaijiensis TaxID=1492673 RepID=UPI003CC73481